MVPLILARATSPDRLIVKNGMLGGTSTKQIRKLGLPVSLERLVERRVVQNV